MNSADKNRYTFPPTESVIEYSSDGIIYVDFGRATATLEENTAEAKWVEATYYSILAAHPDAANKIVVNLSTIGDGEYNSDEANVIYKQLINDEHISFIAVYGLSAGWYLFMEMFKFVAHGKLDIFTTKEKAIAWLQASQPKQ